jgi:hypothetical protein
MYSSKQIRVAHRRRRVMRQNVEPPSRNNLFMIGRNSHGSWVVRDQAGLYGGLFVDRTEALRFALFENGHRPQAVLMVPGILELDFDQTTSTAARPGTRIDPGLHRKAA